MLPTTLMFSIADDVYRPGDPATDREPELYGVDFAGEIAIAMPTALQRVVVIPNLTVELLEAHGAKEATAAVLSSWTFANALTFFQVLALKERPHPAWLAGSVAATTKAVDAILHAHTRALTLIDAQKKSSADGGGTSLPAT